MKKVMVALVVTMMLMIESQAQILTPVKWSYAARKVGKDEAVVLVKATLNKGWHLYSQFVKDGGPVKTTFSFTPSKSYNLIGKTQEPTPVSKYEKAFGMTVSYFENVVVFQQRVKLKTTQIIVKGSVEFMVCNDEQCLPPDVVEFAIQVK